MEADRINFRWLRNQFTAAVRHAKSEYYLTAITDNLNNPRTFWKSIKSISLTKSRNELPPHIIRDNFTISDRLAMLECFIEHFVASGSLLDKSLPPKTSPYNGNVAGRCCVSQPFPFTFTPFSLNDVHKALMSLDIKKPAGPDYLEPYFLKIAADFIAKPLMYIFNLSLDQNVMPSIWKSAHVFPLLKGGDPALLNNYRPISNLSVLSKVLERLVSEQLKEFLSVNNILSEFQSGFRKEHSTISASMKVVNDIIEALDSKKMCAALFIDLSKAFDMVNHCILKQRLLNIGLSEKAAGWFENYLSDTVGLSASPLTVSLQVSYKLYQGSHRDQCWAHFYLPFM